MNLLAFFKPCTLIIINHPHGPSLIANNVQKSCPKHSMKHAKYGGFDQLCSLDYLHYMFQHRHSLIEH